MTTRANYTPDEWKTLMLAPVQAGMTVMLADHSGLVGSAQETMALYNATNKSVARQYADNPLIKDLLAGDNKDMQNFVFQTVGTYIKDANARQQMKPQTLQMCSRVASILKQKAAPQEAMGYKQWLLDVSSYVANAAKEEGGEKVSPVEAATIKEIANALDVRQAPMY